MLGWELARQGRRTSDTVGAEEWAARNREGLGFTGEKKAIPSLPGAASSVHAVREALNLRLTPSLPPLSGSPVPPRRTILAG